jgi:hypothetical protein
MLLLTRGGGVMELCVVRRGIGKKEGRLVKLCVDRVRIEGRREECNIHISP